jgi:hypothetical protein
LLSAVVAAAVSMAAAAVLADTKSTQLLSF